MAENSKIAWTDHTVNFWHGCTKVSAGCVNCYAETRDAQYHPTKAAADRAPGESAVASHWGGGPRLLRVEKAVGEALCFNRLAKESGTRAKVFTSSMADLFEDRADLDEARLEALDVIRRTVNLDWQIVTKRPEKVIELLARAQKTAQGQGDLLDRNPALAEWLGWWLSGKAPANVWMGTTVEDQAAADRRIPELVGIPAAVRFLSCEPLLGPVDLTLNLPNERMLRWVRPMIRMVDWVIAGGESGAKARPMHPDYPRSLQLQCKMAGVPFFFKQWGAYCPMDQLPQELRESLRGELFHTPPIRAGKAMRAADNGRLLDGVEYSAFPEVAHV